MSIKDVCAANPDLAPALANLSPEDRAKVEAIDFHRFPRLKALFEKIKPFINKLTPALLDDTPALIAALVKMGVAINPGEEALIAALIPLLKVLVPKAA